MAVAPIFIFLASCGLVSLTAAFTDRGSPLRYISLAILLWISWIFPPLLASFSDNRGWTGRLLGGSIFWNAVTLFDRLILRGWDFASYSRQTKEASKKTGRPLRDVKTRMEFGSAAAGEARGIGTFWEVKNVPPFEETAPFDVSERMRFVCWHVVIAVGCYYVHNKSISNMLDMDAVMLQDERIAFLSRVSRISMNELYARSVVSLSFWASQRAMLEFFYSMTAALSALAKPEDIKLFPPLFGSLSHAYSVRNAWGKFWHQTLRSGLEGASGFLAHDLLRLPRAGLIQRYSKIFFSFGASGIMHIFADAGGGLPMHRSGAFQFFAMQAVGIMIEDAVQVVWRKVMPSAGSSTLLQSFGKVIGYLWVVAFVVWSSPVWIYPFIREMREEDAMLSFASVAPVFFRREVR